jgi:PEP-CTERM motif
MHFEKIALTFFVLLLCVFSGTAFATPITSINTGTTCLSPATVGAYSSGSMTCDTGNANSWVTFSGFTNSTSANNMPVQALANAANVGFYYPENAGGPMSFQLGYNVQAFNQTIQGVTLHVTATGSAAAHADAGVTMNVCVGQAMGCSASQMMTVTLDANSAFPIQTLNFAPTSMIGISFSGNVDAGADLTQFESTIIGGGGGGAGGNIPEPATLMLTGLGLLAVAARFRLSR